MTVEFTLFVLLLILCGAVGGAVAGLTLAWSLARRLQPYLKQLSEETPD